MCGAIAASASGVSAPRVSNGVACDPALASVVMVRSRRDVSTGTALCSGTVISPTAVLTAAHCLSGSPSAVWLVAGNEQIPAASFVVIPGYQASAMFSIDAAIVIAARDIGRPPIPVLFSREANPGEEAVIAGWGLDGQSVSPAASMLRAGVTVISNVLRTYIETSSSRSPSAVCGGDSGGPLLLMEGGTWAVAGIVSSSDSGGGACGAGTSYFPNVRSEELSAFILGTVPDVSRR